MSTLNRKMTSQICVLVRDVHAKAAAWAKFLQVQMPEVTVSERYDITKAVYRGEPCDGQIYQAIFDMDNIQLEVVGPVDGTSSYWRDYLDSHGEGLHHIAFRTSNMQDTLAELKDEGYDMIQWGCWLAEPKDGQYAYITSKEKLGCVIELLDF